MFSKVLLAALLVAYTQAIHNQGAISTVYFNHHNTVNHIQPAPVISKTLAVPVHSAPLHSTPIIQSHIPLAPVYETHSAPAGHASSYSSLSLSHSAPTGGYSAQAAPVLHAASAGHASSYSSLSLSHSAPLHPSPIIQSHIPLAAAPVYETHSAPAGHASSYSSLSLSHSAPRGGHTAQVAPVLHAAPVAYAAPAVHAVPVVKAVSHHVEEYAHPKYEFAYGVEDHHTGDIHSQKESRDGDITHGEYSLHEADGTIRTVKYSVDKHSGFNAIVERSGHATHAQPAPVKSVLVKAPVALPVYSHHH